jgi:GntR family transcriptional regulator
MEQVEKTWPPPCDADHNCYAVSTQSIGWRVPRCLGCGRFDQRLRFAGSIVIVELSAASGVPLYLQLLRQIRYQVAAGRLNPGDQLPSVRKLSEQLVVNPNTIVRAYRELELAGVLVTRPGAGVYVSESAPQISRREQHSRFVEQLDELLCVADDLELTHEDIQQLMRQRRKGSTRSASKPAE